MKNGTLQTDIKNTAQEENPNAQGIDLKGT
jgi:hypothetical protein